ncbi:ribosomal protection-like ABC-F family protein [Acetonema longum]|uniref:ATPase components of ABC transporter n=1 Tax=Acetonema longum DSM 6540 TaxID=1009370 RepID=F7NP96_9FIRM|nr:ABC-F type ribosomal protection protein [Acetonema longum]EGO62219.1 ATPase components of ABC transporter [Acetonema longum DSM 6540]
MLVLELNDVVKGFGERILFRLDHLKVYSGERIGIVGLNGSGKTTLLKIMAGLLASDQGNVKQYGQTAYIAQLDDSPPAEVDPVLARQFRVSAVDSGAMSGGEKTRQKIAAALSENSQILFADEPTANLDEKGIRLLEERLAAFPGAMILVSHDRELLDALCDRIIELESGAMRMYQGNYSSYQAQKAAQLERQEFEYGQYLREKRKLEAAAEDRRQRAQTMRKTPARMGNSEARLHKMGNQKAKANLDKAVKAMESRLEQLELKERPKAPAQMKLDLAAADIHSKVLIQGKGVCQTFGEKVLFNRADFTVFNGRRTAVIGPNGSGKTTLLSMILYGHPGITVSSSLKIGYFRQDMSILTPEKTLLANVLETSAYDENFVRLTLARLLFKGDAVYKAAGMLSGGERVRVCLARILLSDVNMLILDEPTNYLDIPSLEAVEGVLAEYPGNLLFVSHDRRFVNKVATDLLLIQDQGIRQFPGNYAQYQETLSRSRKNQPEADPAARLVLEHRLSELVSRLAAPGKKDNAVQLDREYREVLAQLKQLR